MTHQTHPKKTRNRLLLAALAGSLLLLAAPAASAQGLGLGAAGDAAASAMATAGTAMAPVSAAADAATHAGADVQESAARLAADATSGVTADAGDLASLDLDADANVDLEASAPSAPPTGGEAGSDDMLSGIFSWLLRLVVGADVSVHADVAGTPIDAEVPVHADTDDLTAQATANLGGASATVEALAAPAGPLVDQVEATAMGAVPGLP